MPADTPARPAETDLMERLAEAVIDALATARNHKRPWPGDERDAVVARDALLRTLAAMPEDEVLDAAGHAFFDTWEAALDGREFDDETLRGAVRSAAGVLLARQAGEMERLRNERFTPVGDNHHNAALCPYCNPELERLRAQLRAAEERAEEAEAMLRQTVHRKSLLAPAAWRPIEEFLAARPASPAEEGNKPSWDVMVRAALAVDWTADDSNDPKRYRDGEKGTV